MKESAQFYANRVVKDFKETFVLPLLSFPSPYLHHQARGGIDKA